MSEQRAELKRQSPPASIVATLNYFGSQAFLKTRWRGLYPSCWEDATQSPDFGCFISSSCIKMGALFYFLGFLSSQWLKLQSLPWHWSTFHYHISLCFQHKIPGNAAVPNPVAHPMTGMVPPHQPPHQQHHAPQTSSVTFCSSAMEFSALWLFFSLWHKA